MEFANRRATLKLRIAFALLAVAATPLYADETPPTQLDGSGAGGGASGTVHDQPRVTSTTIKAERIAMQNGVRIYTGFGSTGARFSRSSEGREQHGKDSDKESQDDEESKEDLCNKSKSGTTKGNPINIATGNKLEPELDFASEGEWPLYLRRTYNHHWAGMGLFGWRWLSNFDYRLSFDTSYWIGAGACYARPSHPECTNTANATTIWVHHPDGSKKKFNKAPDGVFYEAKASPIAKIVRQANGTWMLHGADNMVETYSVGGYPLSIRNEAGIGWSFRYGGLNNTQVQEVTHTSGRSVVFIWGGFDNSELREIRDPAGNAYKFEYTAQKVDLGNHVLSKVVHPGAAATTTKYHYAGWEGEPDGGYAALTGKSINGVRYSWFTYAFSGNQWRATSTRHADDVEKYSFTYTNNADGSMSVAEVNPLGKQATYVFKDDKIQSVTGLPSNHCLGAYRETTYDSNGYEDLVADFNSHFTNYDYLGNGRLQRMIEAFNTPEARTTTYTWDEVHNKVASVTVEGVSRTDYTYTTGNRVASVTVTNLSPNGVPGQTRTTNYGYTIHPNGLIAVATVDGPLANDTATYSYSAQGDLVEVKNALGHAVTYSGHNALGQPGRVTGANGEVTDYQYDERGRLRTVLAVVGGVAQPATVYNYDGFGRFASVQMPDGRARTREFDAAWRVVREYEAEPSGTWAVTRYNYNKASQVTSVTTERTTALNPPGGVLTLNAPQFGYNGTYTIGWSPVSGAEFYRIEEQAGGGSWGLAYEGNASSKAFSGRPAGNYSYRGTACNAAGCSAAVGVWTVQVFYAPSAAPTLTVPIGENTDGSYQVSWTPVAGAIRYQLQESFNGGAWVTVHDDLATFKDLSAKNAGSYSYRARGYNDAGYGPWATPQTVVEIDPPGAPPNVFGPVANDTGSYTISWTTVGGATSYQLDEYIPGGNWTLIYHGGGTSMGMSRSMGQTHYYRARGCNSAGCGANSAQIVVQQPVYGAQFVSQSIPAGNMFPGDRWLVTVQMLNTGNTTWTAGAAYNLGSQAPGDNTRWGLNRVAVPGAVGPGQIATFSFYIGPLSTSESEGGKPFQWRMVRDGVTWFGDQTPFIYIPFENPNDGGDPDPCQGRPNCHEN